MFYLKSFFSNLSNQYLFLTAAKPVKWRQTVMTFGVVLAILGGITALPVSHLFEAIHAPNFATHRIFGRVIDVYTDQKLAKVKVSVDKVSTLTDANGHFELKVPVDPKKKFYKVSFSLKGYESDYLDSIPANSNEEILIGLMKTIRR